jgi:soluble lytic murein transglycosylase-like protein
MINLVGTKMSSTQQDLLVDMIDRVTLKIFDNNKEITEGFITLVAMESAFKPSSKSHAGAVGYAQIIPKYAMEFASHCSLDVTPEDVYEPEINLMLGACLFKHLREEYGNVSLTLVAYNSGKFSKQMKDMKAMKNLSNLETAGYVAKYHYLQEIARNGR